MDLRQLRYFVVLAETLHFGQAAARLGISQPPLSQQVKALEAELGAMLLKRTSRRAELTDAGKRFLVEARKTLLQADHARDVARLADRGEIGELNIGFTPSAPLRPNFRNIIGAYRTIYPDVRLVLHEMATQQQLEELAGGRLQIGFLRTGGIHPTVAAPVVAAAIDNEELVAVLRNDHPLARSNPKARLSLLRFANDPFVVFTREIGGSTYDQVITHCRMAGFEPKSTQEARQVVTLLGLVAAGLGVALIASSFQHILFDGLIIRRLMPPTPMVATWLAHRKNDDSPLTKAFLVLANTPQSNRTRTA